MSMNGQKAVLCFVIHKPPYLGLNKLNGNQLPSEHVRACQSLVSLVRRLVFALYAVLAIASWRLVSAYGDCGTLDDRTRRTYIMLAAF